MRYAFVFVAIVTIWIAAELLAWGTAIDGLFLTVIVVMMTVVLFLIGFRRGR